MPELRDYIKPYVPDTSRKEWASRGERISQLYGDLLPVIQAIQAEHPELDPVRDGKVHAQNVAVSDGFMRLIDLVPNVNQVVINMGTPPREFGPPTYQLKALAKALQSTYAPKTPEIFEQVNAMLKQHLPDGEKKSEALRISDDLEAALNETYLAAETMRAAKGSAHRS
jgi:hypothetical protein